MYVEDALSAMFVEEVHCSIQRSLTRCCGVCQDALLQDSAQKEKSLLSQQAHDALRK